MKKWGTLVLAVILSLACVTAYAAPTFSDMTESWSWAAEAVDSMTEKGMIAGYTDGTYRPGNGVTRLESMLLIARVLGYNEEAMAPAVENAVALYEAELADLELLYPKEICYLIYNGIFTLEEARTYLAGEGATTALKRHEAAFFLTRADGGEQEVRDNIAVALDFEDQDAIPAASLDYVWYVQKHGIMKGMGDNIFSPLTEVNRAQMAVMLYNISEKKGFTYADGLLTEVKESKNTLKLRDAEGATTQYALSENVYIRHEGELISLADLPIGCDVTLQIENDVVVMIEANEADELETVVGVLVGKEKTDPNNRLVVRPAGGQEESRYSLDPACVYTVNGETADYSDLEINHTVTLELVGGKVMRVTAEDMTKTVYGSFSNLLLGDPIQLVLIENEAETASAYELAGTVKVVRNSKAATLNDLAEGDTVTVTLEHNLVTKVTATARTKTVTVTIDEILISPTNSRLNVTFGGNAYSYSMPRDVAITLGGETKTIYDLRLGATVTLTLESNAITAITSATAALPEVTQEVLLAKVVSVNADYGYVVVSVTNASGETENRQILVKEKASIMDAATSRAKDINAIKAGQSLSIVANYLGDGIYETSAIIILQ